RVCFCENGEPFEIGFGGSMQFQWASDMARQFIEAALQLLGGARVFNFDTPSTSMDEVIRIIRSVKLGTQITSKEARLPFPERLEPGKLGDNRKGYLRLVFISALRRPIYVLQLDHAVSSSPERLAGL
ncbi:MAG: hypothetical protein ABIQ77_10970, partial [Anaerolineales bacterium]